MKKLFFVSLFGLLLAACGGGDGDPDNKPKPDPDEPTRDTEQVWRTKALNAVAELESIAERTNEILEEVEYWLDWCIGHPSYYGSIGLYEDLDEIRATEEYKEVEQTLNTWKSTHKLDNYPLNYEQNYDGIIDLYDQCVEFFGQAQYSNMYLYAWFTDVDGLNSYIEANNGFYNNITKSISEFESLLN